MGSLGSDKRLLQSLKMKTHFISTAALFLLACPAPQIQAALSNYHSEVQVSNGGDGIPLVFAFDGGVGVTSAEARLSTSSLSATSMASSQLSASGYVPTLRAFADNSGTRAQAVAWGVQGYTNDSGAELTTTLFLNLSADISGSNDVRASIYLFEEENFEFYKDSGTILFESSSQLWPGFESFANNLGPTGFDVSFKDYDGLVAEQRSFDFTVAPGDSFYVWSQLTTTANSVGTADAYSTLTASFSNTEGLTPAAVNIPEPGIGGLILAGLASLVASCSRSRGASRQRRA